MRVNGKEKKAMWTRTTLEWRGGLGVFPVFTFGRPEDGPTLYVEIREVWTDGRTGHIHVIFSELPSADHQAAFSFVSEAVRMTGCGYSACEFDFQLSVDPISGEHLTETLAKRVIALIRFCGIAMITPPRIVSESIEGRFPGDPDVRKPRAYGQILFDKILGAA
jgi:hypothetical protein